MNGYIKFININLLLLNNIDFIDIFLHLHKLTINETKTYYYLFAISIYHIK